MVFRTLLRLTGSRENLDDLAQDVFLRLYRALPSFRGEALVTTYLYRIAGERGAGMSGSAGGGRICRWCLFLRGRPFGAASDSEWTWEDRLEHPGRNAEELIEEEECSVRRGAGVAASKQCGAECAGSLSSGRAVV